MQCNMPIEPLRDVVQSDAPPPLGSTLADDMEGGKRGEEEYDDEDDKSHNQKGAVG